jgi:hypothetical protein
MAYSLPFFAAETGTYKTTTPNPHVELSGSAAAITGFPVRTFAATAADTEVGFASGDLCSVLVFTDSSNWARYAEAVWTDATPDTIDLSSATLESFAGTVTAEDSVTVYASYPSVVVKSYTQSELAALVSASALKQGDLYFIAEESRLVVGTGTTSYTGFVTEAELQAHADSLGHGTLYALAEQGDKADSAYDFIYNREDDFVFSLNSALPALDGSALTAAPDGDADLAPTTNNISSSTAETAVFSVTVPAEAANTTGQSIRIYSSGYFRNGDSTAQSVALRIKEQASDAGSPTLLWGDTATSYNAMGAGVYRPVSFDLTLIRTGLATARLVGGLCIGNNESDSLVEAGSGDISASPRAIMLQAPKPTATDYSWDWTLDHTLSITAQMSTSLLTYDAGFGYLHAPYADISYTAPPVEPPAPPGLSWVETYDDPDDKITVSITTPHATLTGWPRIDSGSLKQGVTNEEAVAFDVHCARKGNEARINYAKSVNPALCNVVILCSQENQSYTTSPDTLLGYPFSGTGAATTGGNVFAGHWVYHARTTISAGSSISSTAQGVQFYVDQPTRLIVGEYVCIYEAGWTNPEHALVSAVNTSTGLVTLGTRGYKSVAQTHPSGAYVANHVKGNGNDANWALNWVYNASTVCPTDGAGKKYNQVIGEFFADTYDKDRDGVTPAGCDVDGILDDSDFYYFADGTQSTPGSRDADMNNDGIVDLGIINGVNVWGEGQEQYRGYLRAALDARGGNHVNTVLLAGDSKSAGFAKLNGTQLESAYDHNYSAGTTIANWGQLSKMIGYGELQAAHGLYGDRITCVQNKSGSTIYTGATSNNLVRFSMALATIQGHCFSTQNHESIDSYPLYDEMSVDVSTGSAIAKTNYATFRANKYWLGAPLAGWTRAYDETEFAWANNLLSNGVVDGTITGWSATGGTLTSSATHQWNGFNMMRVPSGVTAITGPNTGYTYNQIFTFAFVAYSDVPRRLTLIATESGKTNTTIGEFPLPGNGYSRHCFCLVGVATRTGPLLITTGDDYAAGDMWLAQLGVWNANSGIIYRQYTNGLVAANILSVAASMDLPDTYHFIDGTQDTIVNNGAACGTSLTIPARDGRFLVKITP